VGSAGSWTLLALNKKTDIIEAFFRGLLKDIQQVGDVFSRYKKKELVYKFFKGVKDNV
jgi:hypothetical protein